MRAGEFLNKTTKTPTQLAEKYGVEVSVVDEQLKRGITIEHEHTSDSKIAREIALDHLGEDLYYYKKLAKAEVKESDDLFAAAKTTPQKMAALIRAGKEIWVKDSRDDIWKINEVKPDPMHPWRWYAHWEYGEFPVDNEDYRLDTLDADGSSYILRPIERFDETELTEGASSILYHYTSTRPALRILQSGNFELTSSMGNREETRMAPAGYPYYLSTTRSKVGDYHARIPGSYAVMFVLDGGKIAEHYKVKPVDYWERMWASDTSNTRTRESEDRVFSKTPAIPTAGIIKEIHQLVSGEPGDLRGPIVRTMAILAKTQGIPIYFYNNERAWVLQDPQRRIDVKQIIANLKGTKKQDWAHYSRRISSLEQWIELIYKKNKNELSEEANKLRFNLVYYGSRYPEEDQGLGVDLHNARKPNDTERPLANKIIDYMRKNGFKQTKDLKNALVAKWDKQP